MRARNQEGAVERRPAKIERKGGSNQKLKKKEEKKGNEGRRKEREKKKKFSEKYDLVATNLQLI